MPMTKPKFNGKGSIKSNVFTLIMKRKYNDFALDPKNAELGNMSHSRNYSTE